MYHMHKIVLTVILTSFIFITGCSKYKFYNIAITAERKKAEMVVKETEISIGDIVYLDNDTDTGFIHSEKLTQHQIPMKDRDVILMIHGFGGDKDHFVRLAENMTNDYRILIPDLPGHGDSISDFTDIYTLENQAKWINEFTDTLGIKQFHIVGNAMGGAIAVKVTHLFPDKVSSLTLLNSTGLKSGESEYTQLLKKGVNRLIINSTKEFYDLVDFVMEKKPYIPDAIYEVLAEKKVARKILDQKIFSDINADMGTIYSILPKITKPTLIIWGKKDRVNHVDNADEFHRRIPDSQKIILKDVGHLPMIEDPKLTSSHYASFLLSCKRYY